MRNRFDRQLEMLGEMMIHMGELCETAIEEVTGALENNDMGRAKAVIAADEEIDQMEKTKISVQEFSKKQEEYMQWALLVLLLLLVEVLLKNTLLRNIP